LKPRVLLENKQLEVTLTRLCYQLIEVHNDFSNTRKKELIPNRTNIDFIIEDKNVILVDDVLFTGRTIRAGLDAMLAFGRPNEVELLVLVDRRFSRHVPIQAKYIGLVIDSIETQNVKVEWAETDKKDRVTLIDK
jgi:pyrimidine operon attenuation protein/uracil phosphoribosyltransferase